MISESESQLPDLPTASDVVVMRCLSANPGLIVTFFASSSANAPAIPTGIGADCAQNLADLLDVGFKIQSVTSVDFGSLIYTLIR